MNQTFQPDYASPPGETLAETLEAMGLTQSELARRMGRPIKTINEIIQAKVAITADMAVELERVLGVPAHLWMNMETNYRAQLARRKAVENLEVNA
jgi:HTH-type transcriptional regulator / antitoxin HigA